VSLEEKEKSAGKDPSGKVVSGWDAEDKSVADHVLVCCFCFCCHVHVCVRVYVCMCLCVRVYMCVYVYVCMYVSGDKSEYFIENPAKFRGQNSDSEDKLVALPFLLLMYVCACTCLGC
jgi:hypothetical protein